MLRNEHDGSWVSIMLKAIQCTTQGCGLNVYMRSVICLFRGVPWQLRLCVSHRNRGDAFRWVDLFRFTTHFHPCSCLKATAFEMVVGLAAPNPETEEPTGLRGAVEAGGLVHRTAGGVARAVGRSGAGRRWAATAGPAPAPAQRRRAEATRSSPGIRLRRPRAVGGGPAMGGGGERGGAHHMGAARGRR